MTTKLELLDYIKKHYNGNRAAFGRAQGVQRQDVHSWLIAGYVVIDDELYSKRRTLEPVPPKGSDKYPAIP